MSSPTLRTGRFRRAVLAVAATASLATAGLAGIAGPASADTLVTGTSGSCNVVSNPTPTNHTVCTGDLTGSNFSGLDLSYADFSGSAFYLSSDVNFTGANLTGANFSGLFTTRFNFSGANLTGANLSYTVLIGAQFIGANLTGANLSGAEAPSDFTNSNLTNATAPAANFTGAVFTGAITTGFTFAGANFSGASILPANQLLTATSSAGAVVTYTSFAFGSLAAPVCTPSSGTLVPIGTTMFNCTITDAAGGIATGTGEIRVSTYTPPPVTTPTTTDQCKKDGYKTFVDPETRTYFSNQGRCVSYVVHLTH